MISPETFAEFALADLRMATEYYDYTLYHLDGTCQLRFLDQLMTLPGLHGIEWNPEPGAGSPVLWIEALQDIRRRGFSLLIPDFACESVEEAEELTVALGPDGLMIALPPFASMDAAEASIRRIERVCRRKSFCCGL